MKRSILVLASALCVGALVVGLSLLSRNSSKPAATHSDSTLQKTALAGAAVTDAAAQDSESLRQNGAARASTAVQDSTSDPPSALATAIGKAGPIDFRGRLNAIGKLGPRLSVEERRALYDYLRDSTEEKSLRPGQSHALKNDILNVLREQSDPPQELTQVLAALWRDSSQPLVIRDYALQHLAPWYARAESGQRDQIIQELREASAQTEQSFAGTALIGLHRIQRENPGVVMPSLSDQIARLVQDDTANLLARITAVQLGGGEDAIAMRDSLKRIAVDEAQPPTLRLAALGSLGRLGGDEAAGALTRVAAGTDGRLALAARSALSKLPRLKPSASSGE